MVIKGNKYFNNGMANDLMVVTEQRNEIIKKKNNLFRES